MKRSVIGSRTLTQSRISLRSIRATSRSKGAPKAIVDKLHDVTHAAMETPAIKQRMLDIGITGVAPERRSPEYLARFVAGEISRREDPIRSAGLQVD